MKKITSLITMASLAQELGINKSQLNFWTMEGLIKADSTVANILLYDKKKTLKRIAKIKKLQAEGLKIKEIKHKI